MRDVHAYLFRLWERDFEKKLADRVWSQDKVELRVKLLLVSTAHSPQPKAGEPIERDIKLLQRKSLGGNYTLFDQRDGAVCYDIFRYI